MIKITTFKRCNMLGLRFISIWEAKRNKKLYINYHTHTYHELVYYPSGSGETEIDGKVYQFSEHCFALIPCHTEHNEKHHANAEVICLGFWTADDLPYGFYLDANNKIFRILKELLSEVRRQQYGYIDMLTIKLHELLLHILRSENNKTTTKDFAYIINHIRENFHDHINLPDCARQLNISYDYFQHKFKALTGYSPQQFLMEQRLLASTKMLKKGDYNCTEIAYRCGFCTSAQFSTLFKKRYGVTPLQYKAQHRQQA